MKDIPHMPKNILADGGEHPHENRCSPWGSPVQTPWEAVHVGCASGRLEAPNAPVESFGIHRPHKGQTRSQIASTGFSVGTRVAQRLRRATREEKHHPVCDINAPLNLLRGLLRGLRRVHWRLLVTPETHPLLYGSRFIFLEPWGVH